MRKKIITWGWMLCVLVGIPVTMGVAHADTVSDAHQVVVTAIPAKAYVTLQKIDKGTWPKTGSPGTKGGGVWQNREKLLPMTNSQGQRITYREWDVNDKIKGHNRDAQRIITGSDHSAWYTGDHYRTFERMR